MCLSAVGEVVHARHMNELSERINFNGDDQETADCQKCGRVTMLQVDQWCASCLLDGIEEVRQPRFRTRNTRPGFADEGDQAVDLTKNESEKVDLFIATCAHCARPATVACEGSRWCSACVVEAIYRGEITDLNILLEDWEAGRRPLEFTPS